METEQTTAPAPDATQTPTTSAETTPVDKTTQMDAIVGKIAGNPQEPEKKEEPSKQPEPAKQEEPPKPAKRVDKLLSQLKDKDAKLADLQSKYNELAAKVKDGKATELDEYKMAQIEEQTQAIAEASAQEYFVQAAEALGDDFDSFQENSGYYVPVLNQHAPDFAKALAGSEFKFTIMNELFKGVNNGTIDLKKFLEQPAPRQIAFLRYVENNMRNPQPAKPTPPAREPPKVPVPNDVAMGSPPTDKKAKMNEILGRMSRGL